MGDASVVWFRQDLRLADNPALEAAVNRGGEVIALFIWSPEEEGTWRAGGAAKWWLHHSLGVLSAQLAERGSTLILRRGPTIAALDAVIRESEATAVFWNRRYEPAIIQRDAAIKERLRSSGLVAESFNANLLFEPWDVKTQTGTPFQVFTPFWKSLLKRPAPAKPTRPPALIPAPQSQPRSLGLDELGLMPKLGWASGFREYWTPGCIGAAGQLVRFRDALSADYPTARDIPGIDATSRLSPHLHWGELSPRAAWHAIFDHFAADVEEMLQSPAETFLRELCWREFAHHLLYHFPHTPIEPLKTAYEAFPWQPSQQLLRAWQRGETGYPIVDAGMRQLWRTGWMHNRVRMVVASFLIKDLLQPWQRGAEWFWDTLVDADLASNTLGWQWTAGCGADAAPFFRIFNPVMQGEKFDAAGDYVRKWIPEIAKLSNARIHQPWTASAAELTHAGIVLGRTYPQPIIDHHVARGRALAALEAITSKSA